MVRRSPATFAINTISSPNRQRCDCNILLLHVYCPATGDVTVPSKVCNPRRRSSSRMVNGKYRLLTQWFLNWNGSASATIWNFSSSMAHRFILSWEHLIAKQCGFWAFRKMIVYIHTSTTVYIQAHSTGSPHLKIRKRFFVTLLAYCVVST